MSDPTQAISLPHLSCPPPFKINRLPNPIKHGFRSSISASSTHSSPSSASFSLPSFDVTSPPSTPQTIINFMDQVADIDKSINHLEEAANPSTEEVDEALRIGSRLNLLLYHQAHPPPAHSNLQERRLRTSQIHALRCRLCETIPRLKTEQRKVYTQTRDELGKVLAVVMGQKEMSIIDLESLIRFSSGEFEKMLAESVRESRNYPASRTAAKEAVDLIERWRGTQRRWHALFRLSQELCMREPRENSDASETGEEAHQVTSGQSTLVSLTPWEEGKGDRKVAPVKRSKWFYCAWILLVVVITMGVILSIIFLCGRTQGT